MGPSAEEIRQTANKLTNYNRKRTVAEYDQAYGVSGSTAENSISNNFNTFSQLYACC